jgi:hypothetical protein
VTTAPYGRAQLAQRRSAVKTLIAVVVAVVTAAIALAAPARAGDSTAIRYYVALGDSLSVGVQPSGPPPTYETADGYADQLYATLAVTDPKLKLVKLGCGGESTTSMRFGSHANRNGYGLIAQAVVVVLALPFVDDEFSKALIGLPQFACPQGYLSLVLYQKPSTDPLWQYDHNHDAVICRRST